LFANAWGKNETELKVVWNILEQGGKQKKSRPRKEDEDDVDDITGEAPEGKGNEYRLLAWQERASADSLGENRSGNPAALIDKLHRLMFLFRQNRTAEVQQLFEAWGLSIRVARPRRISILIVLCRAKAETWAIARPGLRSISPSEGAG
jgi:hypothetical protein